MSLFTKLAIVAAVIALPGVANASVDHAELRAAQQQVDDYRALRRSCNEMIDEAKQKCFSDLREQTDDYKKAKRFLVMNKPSTETILLGSAQ